MELQKKHGELKSGSDPSETLATHVGVKAHLLLSQDMPCCKSF